MPYVKSREVPFVTVRRLLLGRELDATALAKVLGCSYNTAKKRLDNPGSITLEELDRVCRSGHVPMDDIRAAIIR